MESSGNIWIDRGKGYNFGYWKKLDQTSINVKYKGNPTSFDLKFNDDFTEAVPFKFDTKTKESKDKDKKKVSKSKPEDQPKIVLQDT